jgi:cytochrome c peroxidase
VKRSFKETTNRVEIGIANGGANNNNPDLDIADLPVFTLSCVSGPNVGQTYTVTDPGRALISGKCADIGKMKGPILRGLVGRAPYFHNGSAAIPSVVPGNLFMCVHGFLSR